MTLFRLDWRCGWNKRHCLSVSTSFRYRWRWQETSWRHLALLLTTGTEQPGAELDKAVGAGLSIR